MSDKNKRPATFNETAGSKDGERIPGLGTTKITKDKFNETASDFKSKTKQQRRPK